MESFLVHATVYLATALVTVPLAARMGLGSVLGYLLAGLLIGPGLGLVGTENHDLQHFAEFGVVMMLFLIGLELEPRHLWDMRHKLLGMGGLQILLTLAAVTFGLRGMGWGWSVALALGMVFALSSTAIVLQTLTEKGLMRTGGGRATFSVLLTQDIAVIPMLALLPLLALPQISGSPTGALPAERGHMAGLEAQTQTPHPPATPAPQGPPAPETGADEAAEAARTLIENLPGWGVTLATLGVVALIILFGRYATHPLFRFIHGARLQELHTGFALLIVCGIAATMNIVGVSPALGTFLAGVVLASSEFRHELESSIAPFKGLLLGLFFITVGAGIDINTFLSAPVTVLSLTLALMAIKGTVLFALTLIFGLKGRDRWLFTLGLAQAGEFGFVLISFALQTRVLPPDLASTALLVIAMSMLLTPLFFIGYEALARRVQEQTPDQPADEIDQKSEIIIAGMGRFGQIVNRMVRSAGFETTMLDASLTTIRTMRRFGFKGFFGDPTRPDLLHAAGLDDAKVLVVAMDNPANVVKLVAYARRQRPDLHIIARARDRVHVYQLYRAGADDIVREMFDSSLRAGRYALETMGLSDYEAHETERSFFKLDRASVRELAALWDPAIPVTENDAYVAKARELNTGLETALVTEINEKRRARATPPKPDASAE